MEIRNENPEMLTVGWIPGPLLPGEYTTTFVVKATLRLVPGATAEAREEPPAVVCGDQREDDDDAKPIRYASDFAPFKPRADVLVTGTVYAPGGAATVAQTTIQVGTLVKTLVVVGDREWQGGGFLRGRAPSDPKPFESIPLSYRLAHGGPEFAQNPLGRGHRTDELPNFELPGQLLTSQKEKTPPAGFGPLAPDWEPRRDMVGTYHDKWAAERWPCPPRDFDFAHFNAAPADQQVEGYLRGDENLRFQHLHSEIEDYCCDLPGLRARCFLNRAVDDTEKLSEVELHLDTLWADLDEEIVHLVWRGRAPVRSGQMTDVLDVFVFAEPLEAATQSDAEYRARMERVDAEEEEEDEGEVAPLDFDEEMQAIELGFEADMAELQAEEAAAESAASERFAALAASGIEIPSEAADAVAAMKAMLDRGDVAPEDVKRVQRKIAELEEAESQIAAAEQEIADLEAGMSDDAATTRADVEARLEAGGGFAGEELTGLDLSQLDFSGIDLSEADLSGANLSGAKFTEAKLAGADLGGANLTDVDFTGAVLDDADLSGGQAIGAQFRDASIADADLSGLDLSGADFSGASGEGADLSGANLAGASFVGADLPRIDLMEADLSGANCADANFSNAEFYKSSAVGISFQGANISELRASGGADFTGADLAGVTADDSIWEVCVMDAVSMSSSSFARAQFTGSSLKSARCDHVDFSMAMFDDAVLTGASMVCANLIRASFVNADLVDVNFSGSNLFEAGFVDARCEGVVVEGANIGRTLLETSR